MGIDHGCAIADDGYLWCWGSHEHGQLGLGAVQTSSCGGDCLTRPARMTTAVDGTEPTWSRVSAGSEVTCAIRETDASLWCWGSNANARMGASAMVLETDEPMSISPASHRSVDNEGRGGCALRMDGVLSCWGENGHGQVGQGSTGPDVYGPLPVPDASDWDEVSVGNEFVCAARSERLWCWGNNFDGQLGTGESGSVNHPEETGFLGGSVDAGDGVTCGLDLLGVGHCWGDNRRGEVGNGDPGGNDVEVPTPIAGSLSFVSFSLGAEFSCALTEAGAAYCWGRNRYEQLGVGQSYDELPEVAVPSRVGSDADWASLSAGGDSACALRENGSLWCWGRNHRGQLGVGDTDDRMSPTRVCF